MSHIQAPAGSFDQDGTLYPYPQNKNKLFDNAVARSVIKSLRKHGVMIGSEKIDEFTEISQISYQQTSHPLSLFAKKDGIAHQHGISFDTLAAEFNSTLPKVLCEAISPQPALIKDLNNLIQNGISVALATNSGSEATNVIVPHIGLSETFNRKKGNIVTLDEYGHEHVKKESDRLYTHSANSMGFELGEIAIYDDEHPNFIPVKDSDHRVTTVFVTHGKTPDKKPAHCDHMVETTIEAVQMTWYEPKTISLPPRKLIR